MHRHYQENYEPGRYPFEWYEIAYTYGFDLATDERYPERNWLEIEEGARRGWEEKGAIRLGWETAREAMVE